MKNNRRPIQRVRKSLTQRYFSRRKVFPFLFALTLVLFACTLVWQQVHVLDMSTTVRGLEKENETLSDLLKKRKTEITELTRLSAIKEKALVNHELRRTATEHLFTLVRDDSYRETDGIDNLVGALKKVADNMPVINETRAESGAFFEFDEE